MNRQRIEAKTIDMVRHVVGGGIVEDDLVECKSEWIDATKAARRLAAHANAARGEAILWIVGLDEKGHRVVPLDSIDLATWWAQVEARFADDVTPDLTQLTVITEDGDRVVALAFETDRAPFVVKVSDDRRSVDREVPWRSGTRTRSAKRQELLSLLVSLAQVPEIELLEASVSAGYTAPKSEHGEQVPAKVTLRLDGYLFFDAAERCMLPTHLQTVAFDVDGMLEPLPAELFLSRLGKEPPEGTGIVIGFAGLYVHGPDALHMMATASLEASIPTINSVRMAQSIICTISLPLSSPQRAARTRVRLNRVTPADDEADSKANYGLGLWRPSAD